MNIWLAGFWIFMAGFVGWTTGHKHGYDEGYDFMQQPREVVEVIHEPCDCELEQYMLNKDDCFELLADQGNSGYYDDLHAEGGYGVGGWRYGR